MNTENKIDKKILLVNNGNEHYAQVQFLQATVLSPRIDDQILIELREPLVPPKY